MDSGGEQRHIFPTACRILMISACARDEEHHATVDQRNGLTVACVSPQRLKISFNSAELHQLRVLSVYGVWFLSRWIWSAIFIFSFFIYFLFVCVCAWLKSTPLLGRSSSFLSKVEKKNMSGLGFDDETDNFSSSLNQNVSNQANASTSARSESTAINLAGGSMLGYTSVLEVCKLFGSQELADLIREIQKFQKEEETSPKNAIVKDDPEHKVVMDCAKAVWKLEGEKSLAHRFVVDHYSLRLPELALLVPSDAVIYCKLVQLIGNDIDDLSPLIEEMDALIPSQISSILVAVCSTTQGMPLDKNRLAEVKKGCEHVHCVESLKQIFLDYIQQRMPLIAPNVCAFLGAALTSQIFTMCESLERLSQMDQAELIELGSHRRDKSGIKVHTSGFLSNCDLVLIHPPEIRTKALRLIAPQVLELARIDENRRAPDDSQGIKAREDVRMKMIRWSDPLLQRGAANNTYERLSKAARERRARMAQAQRQQHQIARDYRNRFQGGRGGYHRQRHHHQHRVQNRQ